MWSSKNLFTLTWNKRNSFSIRKKCTKIKLVFIQNSYWPIDIIQHTQNPKETQQSIFFPTTKKNPNIISPCTITIDKIEIKIIQIMYNGTFHVYNFVYAPQ